MIGGMLLLIFTVVAILCANIPALSFVHNIWSTDLSLSFSYNAGFLSLHTVGDWVNSGLMVIFFFVIGLELKREGMVGELSSTRNGMLPLFAAAGGLLLPLAIYVSLNVNGTGGHGWGIPMSTDVVFALALLALLGKRVPLSLKVFLAATAIAGSMIAVIAMAVCYPSELHVEFLAAAACVLGALIALNYMRVNRTFPYTFFGILLWFFMLRSGIHASVAGIALALTIPSRVKVNQVRFYVRSKYMIERYRDAYRTEPLIKNEIEQAQLNNLTSEIRRATPLLVRLQHALQPWVTYFILPLFALVNAGVVINGEALSLLTSPIAVGIFLGLLLGKPIGIALMSWLAVKLKLAAKPDKSTWAQVVGIGILSGVGFSVSIFTSTIAFSGVGEEQLLNAGKLATLVTSLCAGVLGVVYMNFICKKEAV
jgi:NhaA family Na+:H+ antiporter